MNISHEKQFQSVFQLPSQPVKYVDPQEQTQNESFLTSLISKHPSKSESHQTNTYLFHFFFAWSCGVSTDKRLVKTDDNSLAFILTSMNNWYCDKFIF